MNPPRSSREFPLFPPDSPRAPAPTRTERDVYSVSRLNKEVRLLLESGPAAALAGRRTLEFRRTRFRPLVFLAEGQQRAGALRHVAPAKFAGALPAERWNGGAGPCARRSVRTPRRIPAARRASRGSRRRRAQARVRKAEDQAGGRRLVCHRTQAGASRDPAPHWRRHFTHGCGHPRHIARLARALSRRRGAALPHRRPGRGRGAGDRAGDRSRLAAP